MGSLSTVVDGWTHPAVAVKCSDSPSADNRAGLWTVEAAQDPMDGDDGDGPCVVCGRRTLEAVRPMGAITALIWCCHEHDDRSIVRAWIHSLPEWQQLQTASPSPCAACASPCHCVGPESVEHRCACWPPGVDDRALVTP